MGMTLAELTRAIQQHIDLEMDTEVAQGMAEHALGFFGFYNRIIDNALEPTDRNLFYMFQDYDLLTTESDPGPESLDELGEVRGVGGLTGVVERHVGCLRHLEVLVLVAPRDAAAEHPTYNDCDRRNKTNNGDERKKGIPGEDLASN